MRDNSGRATVMLPMNTLRRLRKRTSWAELDVPPYDT
jgi:hypothetical protein